MEYVPDQDSAQNLEAKIDGKAAPKKTGPINEIEFRVPFLFQLFSMSFSNYVQLFSIIFIFHLFSITFQLFFNYLFNYCPKHKSATLPYQCFVLTQNLQKSV